MGPSQGIGVSRGGDNTNGLIWLSACCLYFCGHRANALCELISSTVHLKPASICMADSLKIPIFTKAAVDVSYMMLFRIPRFSYFSLKLWISSSMYPQR
ncbi:hypothetical protein TNCV_1145361 [Trichonephila clavipes]|nr:hypothetical protein TNCV_1145361 [Trichonephila clavipes]